MTYTDMLNSKKADIGVYYKKTDNLKLPMQVFLPSDFNIRKKYKTIIAIHGGGWHSLKETPADWNGGWMANTVKYYAQRGYIGIVFSYRDLNFTIDGDVENLITDCRDALKYISDNFLFVDNENIIFMGDSAGGHLALCLAMNLYDGEKLALIPKKLVVYNPITDCVTSKWNYMSQNKEKYSPIHNIRNIHTNIMLMHGTDDESVSINDSRQFTEKMKLAGNDISMIEIEGAKHAFILFGYTADENEVLAALKLTDEWLECVQ